LFKLLRKSILNPSSEPNSTNSNPTSVEAHLGKPPFEEPSISKGIINFLFCKYGKSGDQELQYMFEASKLFLYCLNMWKFETPTSFFRRQSSPAAPNAKNTNGKSSSSAKKDEPCIPAAAPIEINNTQQKLISLYKLNYTRWICYNYVPSFCDSLEKYETIMIFGISFLKLVFSIIKQEIQEKFISEKDKIPSEKRAIFSNYLPK
jgi:histone acetyltransferase